MRIRGLARLRRAARGTRRIPWYVKSWLLFGKPTLADPALAPGVRICRDGPIFLDKTWSPSGATTQFIGDADTYHQRYFDRLDFVELIDTCLSLAGVERERPLKVLDIGSGGGSSVFAACRLLPKAEICASDMSPQLLRTLAAFVESRDELRGRITAYCFDVQRKFFRRDTFDLVIGAAILHHLLDPRAALTHVAGSLKPGGKIILVEPLEAGSLLLTSVYGAVLRVLADLGEADGDLAQVMKALRLDIQSRLGAPVEKPWTERLDDKWVFDESYLALLAAQLGLAKVEVHPAQADLTHVFEAAFKSVLADSGNQELPIPETVLDCVREFDRCIDPALKRRFCPTGIIVFTK